MMPAEYLSLQTEPDCNFGDVEVSLPNWA